MTQSPLSYNILVVDDNAASAQTLGWMLELLGHKIELAHSAGTAFDKATASHPDVILLDIGLPDMNGYDLCKKMRQDPMIGSAYIIAQTGWDQKEHRDRSQAAGFDCHLVKPIDIKLLEDALRSISTETRQSA